ncbi:MAG: PaaX family transcriptional regulator C-terminal domain-containing protein [Polyangiales bacterium]
MARKHEDSASGPSRVRATAVEDWLRPQSVVFTLLAEHVLPRGAGAALGCGSMIEVLARLEIGEHATRSTLARMTRRGLLERHKRGREIYFGMTPRCAAILEDGRKRIWHMGAVNPSAAEDFTLLTFSMPESLRRERYDLRARLTWAGFGLLQNGAWLAPSRIDVAPIVAELDLGPHVRVFRIRAVPPTDPAAVIRETFDLTSLAERYRAFSAGWRKQLRRKPSDALSLTLRLSTQWLRIIRDDPRVPVRLLPRDWPAIEAQRIFRTLHRASFPRARALAASVLDLVEL